MKLNLKAMINSVKFKLDKNSPEILVVTGVVGMVGAAILACRATVKAKAIKEDKNEQLEVIAAGEEKGVTIDNNNEEVAYSAEDAKKDRRTVKVKAWLKYGKVFTPAIVIGTLSISAILFGHNILRRRYISLGSAYTALDKAYTEYRKRVEEKYGKEAEEDIHYGISEKSQGDENVEFDPKVATACSPYAKFFDSSCDAWQDDYEQNIFTLKSQEAVWTNILQKRGWLSLNEVYTALGWKPTVAGQTIGWLFDKNHPNTRVDFGLHKANNLRFINGYENVVLCDFNVTGDIREAFKRNGGTV